MLTKGLSNETHSNPFRVYVCDMSREYFHRSVSLQFISIILLAIGVGHCVSIRRIQLSN